MTLSEAEAKKLKSFFEGGMLIAGWNSRVAKLLRRYQGDQRRALEQRLGALGTLVGEQWARRDGVVSTADLQAWGRKLQAAEKRGYDEFIAMIDKVEVTLRERLG